MSMLRRVKKKHEIISATMIQLTAKEAMHFHLKNNNILYDLNSNVSKI